MKQQTYNQGLTKTDKLEHAGIVLEFASVPGGFTYAGFLPDANKAPYRVINGFFAGHELTGAIKQAHADIARHLATLAEHAEIFAKHAEQLAEL